MARDPDQPHVSRAGRKLEHALRTFGINPDGLTAADLGCNVGGFTDCLLQHGARKVYSVDTAYGTLDWSLRNDPRVVVMERTNALHVEPPERIDLVVIDLGWTVQRHAIPAGLRWVRAGGCLVSLIKPHYERSASGAGPGPGPRSGRGQRGTLSDGEAMEVLEGVLDSMPALGVRVEGWTQSPIRGGKSGRRGAGNIEFLAHLTPMTDAATAGFHDVSGI